MREALAEVRRALAACQASPVWALSGQSLVSCVDAYFQLRAQLDAVGLALIREADAQGTGIGQGTPHPQGDRTPGQRRVDALVEVCRLALSCGELPDNGGDRPQVVLTMDLDMLRRQVGAATLDDGSLITATEARLLACDAGLIPAVLGGAGQVLDLGRERRLYTGPIRRAVLIRDRGCALPACDRPSRWCSVHHIQHWADGGSTSVDNGVMLCAAHHRIVHQGQWQVRINPHDRLPEFIPPPYVDSTQRPQRNHYHRRN